VGSFHSRLRVQEDQTERYFAALNNPEIQILGHPRGRVYNFRLGLTADWPRVFACASKAGKAVELDCYPDRQDLDIALLKVARDHGAYLAIDTDAHHPEQLAFIELGLAAAAQARFPKERIINFFSRDKLLEWVHELRARTGRRSQLANGPGRRPCRIKARNGPIAAIKVR
jgi:DNA polymerase (family 10)